MYIISFIKSLLHPRNILSTIYFLINMAMIFGICYFLSFPFVEDTTKSHVYAGLIGVGVNFIFILISLSPVGEFFWRLTNGIYGAPPAAYAGVWQKAQEAFNDVKGRARNKSWTVSSKVKLYYSAENYVNAFALGHRTVILTQGMLNINDYNVFRGVIAHEFGHIAHGDSDLNLGINVCNVFISLIMSFLSIFSYIVVGVLMANDSDNACLILLLRWVFNVILVFIFRLWSVIGVICINATSRKKEYAADKYAKDLGYGRELAAFLASLGDGKPSSNWFSLMFQSHPATPDRIKALRAA